MLEQQLNRYFGYSSFRSGQKEIIEEIMKGKDVLGILPTGSGKSICYQLPSMILPGLTVVVSPLIALMEDQVYQLRNKGITIATYINSHITYSEYQHRWNHVRSGKIKLLYVSPEKFQQKSFIRKLKEIKVSLFVVDEAHCISEWGHDFRTDYLRLKEVIKQLGHPPVLCLTATATSYVQKDIINQLALESVQSIITTFDRNNIAYQAISVDTFEEKKQLLFQILEHLNGSGIIYVNSRQSSEWITDELKLNGFHDIEAYHAGLPPEDRMIIQQQFMREELRIIVATKAFGMGIDKNNIRFVIHFDIPSSMESYVQETGRIARDGGQGIAVLLYQQGNEDTVQHFIDSEYPERYQLDWICTQINNQPLDEAILYQDSDYLLNGLTKEKFELILFYLEKEYQILWSKDKEQFSIAKGLTQRFLFITSHNIF
ncbi:ATP-dependent DNA helicase RecQ [Tepidibacillus marianensis]|uniref:RecQ family ATP-dependent DNA helicase n=1 Tax=Tepidibacillus marianensis TaxID=3131995 RepID=UPI0030CF690A